jgi:hypothetical protein
VAVVLPWHVCVCVFNCFWPFTGLVATLCIRHNSIIKRERQTQRDSERERERVSKNHAVETSTCPHLGSFAGEGPFSRTDGQNTRTKVSFFFF